MNLNEEPAFPLTPANSTRFGIAIIDLATRKTTVSPVTAKLNGNPVTEAMVIADVRRLNAVAGLDGKTLKRLPKQPLAFQVVKLQ